MVNKEFVGNYIQKDATQQKKFLKKYPECDGKGLLIAILDTGVDLSFPGMQKTSTGLPKVIESFDFTGAGNVDTSIVKESKSSNNTVIGLTGRKLKIPSYWVNPSGKWHLGMKSIYEMCSKAALETIINKRKKSISEQNKILEQSIIKNSNEYCKAASEYLKMTEDLSEDSLVADCIVWFNGEKWQACVDTSFVGDLKNVEVLTNFNIDHEYATVMDTLCFCIKIHENGNLLEIISAIHDHGSSVAQVAAACFPEESAKNGLAPGAQIISMTVMDSRNGTCLNYNALKKAFEKCIEMKVDIVNCSFGCSTKYFENLITKMTETHGIIIIYAAGNCGTVHSSLDRSISSNPNIYMIGSVTKKKHKNAYEVTERSSRGPNIFGDRGVCFVAPGHATTTYPNYYPETTLLEWGTSLAAPNVAGSIACLLSALKGVSMEYSPTSLKFALSRSARLPQNGNELSYGYGIIQILAAFDFFKHSEFSKLCETCNYRVKLSNEDKNGIIMKLKGEEENKTYSIEILNNPSAEQVKLKLNKEAQKYIECSNVESHSFKAELKTQSFKSGTINYAQICGINETNLTTFYLPITILKPQKVTKEENYHVEKEIILNPKDPFRLFLLAPEKSHQCIVKVTALEKASSSIQIHHAIEDLDVDRYKEKCLKFDASNKIQTYYIKVFGKKILEIFLHLSSSDSIISKFNKFKLEINFFGIHQKVSEPEENKNVVSIFNYLEPLPADFSLEFNKVSYNLLAENVCNEKVKHVYDSEPSDCLKLSYFFSVTHEMKFSFQPNHKKDYPVLRAQVFTESKKFVHGFFHTYDKFITLLPGKYSIIAYVIYSSTTSDLNNNINIPPTKELPSITLTMELQTPITPEIYSNPSKLEKSDNTEKLIKTGKYEIHFQQILSNKFLNPIPSTITLEGALKISNTNLNMDVPIKHEYNLSNKKQQKKTNDSNPDSELSSLAESFKDVSINVKNSKKRGFSTKNSIKPLPKNLNKIQKEVITACRNFLQKSKSDLHQKEIDSIEEAIASEHYGLALFLMNEFSTKNQTNPNFKVIDSAVITLLKHLKWNHLVEAHQNALLDRHRDHYRLL